MSESMQQRLNRLEKEIKEIRETIAKEEPKLANFKLVKNHNTNKWVLLNEKEYISYREIGEQLYFR